MQPPWGPPGGYGPPPPPPQHYVQPYYQQPPPPQVIYVQNNTRIVKAPFNHAIHIVLDFLTCGAWIPIHLICWALH